MNNNINNASKKKKALIFIVIVICAFILVGIGVVVAVNNRSSEPKNPTTGEKSPNNNQSIEESLTESEKGNLLNEIMLIATDLYNSGKYLELPKSDVSGYYATVLQLKNMGYTDIDSLLTHCSDGHAIIFFDVDHMEKYPDSYPIMAVRDCSQFTVN